MNNINLLHRANLEYERGNLPAAKQMIQDYLSSYNKQLSQTGSPNTYSYFNALTLAQSVAARMNDLKTYEQYEANIRELTLSLTGEYGESYYAVHLLDACEMYLNVGSIVHAQKLLTEAVEIMTAGNNPCSLISFLRLYLTAKLHFKMEQYHQCLACCHEANDLWMKDSLIPSDSEATPFLLHYRGNEELILKMVYSNIILACCTYGKINSPETGIHILLETMTEPIDDHYLRTSADIILAELYTRAGKSEEARAIYEQYRSGNFTAYPNLAASLATLSVILESPADTGYNNFFQSAPAYDGELVSSGCYSQDALEILSYNHILSLIAGEQYEQALSLSHQLGERSLSLKLLLLAKTGNYTAIPTVFRRTAAYYSNEIQNLFLYYHEELVFNHLSLLEYHTEFCLNSYFDYLDHVHEQKLSAEESYDFLLSTKYISLEASYISHHFRTLQAMEERKPFTSKQIMKCLNDDTILLEFCISRSLTEQYYNVFIITHRQIQGIRLTTVSELDNLLEIWNSRIRTSVQNISGDSTQSSQDIKEIDTLLRRHLYRPIKDILAGFTQNNIIIAPAGNLVHFPFGSLSTSSHDTLGDRYQITYVNTGKELITNPYVTDQRWDSALLIGGPSYLEYEPLPYAKQEIQAAANALASYCYTDSHASAALLAECKNTSPTLLHIAAHGIFHENDTSSQSKDWNQAYLTMNNSGLLLAEDTLVSCTQIATMNFSNTGLAILSACCTGKGLFHNSEGIFGLRRAFRLAGCHSMILTLWQINDLSGCCFMEYFYQHLTQQEESCKEAFFSAIKDLQQHTDENGHHPFAHPYYWAGYIFME